MFKIDRSVTLRQTVGTILSGESVLLVLVGHPWVVCKDFHLHLSM